MASLKKTIDTDDIYKTEVRVMLPLSVVRCMKIKSKQYTGLKCSNEGSIAHFARAAILRELKNIGSNFEIISDGKIKIPEYKSRT